MTLNHLNLVVTNVAEAIALFEHYFDFKTLEIKGDNIIAIMQGADGFSLVLMSAKENTAYPDAFHFGFMLDSKEQVDSTYAKFKAGNVDAGREPAKIRDSYGFYFHFQNVMIEVACYN